MVNGVIRINNLLHSYMKTEKGYFLSEIGSKMNQQYLRKKKLQKLGKIKNIFFLTETEFIKLYEKER